MNLIDRFIYSNRRLFPNFLRDTLSRFYLTFHKLKCFVIYGNADMFDFITIELDRICNRSCSYCPKSVYDDRDNTVFFNKENFVKIINQLQMIKYRGSILFSGYYEPLMNKNIKEYLLIARKNFPNNKLVVYTNGDFLNKEFIRFARENKITLIITIHTPASYKDKCRIEKIVGDYKDAVIKYKIEDHYLSTRGNLVDVKKKIIKKLCIRPACELTVDYKGNVILCSNDFFSKQVFGNLNNKKIMEIWNTKKFREIRKKLAKKVPNSGICKYCRNV